MITAVLVSSLLGLWAKPGKRNGQSLESVFGVWKYEQVFPEDPYCNGISKKEFILKLNQDGTYLQTVQVTPLDKKYYRGRLVYQLKGEWKLKGNVLYIDEYGKALPIEVSDLRDKFTYFGDEETLPVAAAE